MNEQALKERIRYIANSEGRVFNQVWRSLILESCLKPLFEKSISLQVYPLETIFAEKLESIVSRASANTRMKDYHDLILLCRSKNIFNYSKLKKDITKTFKRRREKQSLPLQLSNKELNILQKLWTKHRDNLHENTKSLKLPANIKEAIAEINNWLLRNNFI